MKDKIPYAHTIPDLYLPSLLLTIRNNYDYTWVFQYVTFVLFTSLVFPLLTRADMAKIYFLYIAS